MSKYRLQYIRGGLEFSKQLSKTGTTRMEQIIWRFNFKKPYGYHRIQK